MKKLAVLGGGNMGEALISGLLRSKKWTPKQIVATDIRPEALARLKKKYRIETAPENLKAIRRATLILIAVKPQQIAGLMQEIGPSVSARQVLISIAAGIPTAYIERHCSVHVPVVRVMPNTPALVGAGAAAVAPGQWAKPADVQAAKAIFETVGTVVGVAEKDIDAVTAVSGSGPAYAFYLAEAMQEAGREAGLDPRIADQLVRQTLKGAGLLLSQSADDAAVLRQRVTSPGGTTEAALRVMDDHGMRQTILKAVKRAKERAEELSQAY